MNLKAFFIKYSTVKALTAIALFVCFMVALRTLQDHVTFYQEQHTLFLFTSDYFRHTLHYRGLADWLADFVIQFYYIPLLGSAIVAGLLTGVYLLVESIINRLTGLRDYLQLGVVAAIALYLTLDGVDESPRYLVAAFGSLLLVWLLTLIVKRKRLLGRPTPEKNGWWRPLTAVVLAAAYIIAGLQIEMRGYNRSERAMIITERAIKQKNWDGAIAVSSKYLFYVHKNRLMIYLRNLALAQKGELVNRMFDFPEMIAPEAFAFKWRSDSRDAEYGHWIHEFTGDINAAHQWAFEAMTSWGETAPHLIDLARYNMALGRPAVARKFASKLEKSLFYRNTAREMLQAIDRGEKGDLRYAHRDESPDSLNIKWVNVHDFRPNLMQNYKSDPDNPITRQYLMASLLADKELTMLMPMLTPEDMNSTIINQAVLIYNLNPNLPDSPLELRKDVTDQFARYMDAIRKPTGRRLVKEHFGTTYWYYVHNIKPGPTH